MPLLWETNAMPQMAAVNSRIRLFLVVFVLVLSIVFVIPFASLKAQTSYEKCCAPPLFDL